MALKVWLPLMGDLHNQGYGTPVITGSPSFSTNGGKLNSKYLNTTNQITINTGVTGKIISVSCWCYIDSAQVVNNWTGVMALGDGGSNLRTEVCPKTYSNGLYCYSVHNNSANKITNTAISDVIGGHYDQWIHYCLVSDGVTIKRYINGVAISGSIPYNGTGAFNGYLYLNNNHLAWKQDLRVYDHALTAEEVHELAQGLVLHYPLNGNGWTDHLSYYFRGIELSDGSKWVPLLVHDIRGGTNLFSSSDAFATGVYRDDNKWAYFNQLNTLSRPDTNYWEILVKQQTSIGGAWSTYRWKQKINPLVGTWANCGPSSGNVTWISGYSGTAYGGMYKFNSSIYMCFSNTSNGNWFGCGSWTEYQGGIPSVCNTVAKGFQLVYLRVTDAQYKAYNDTTLTLGSKVIGTTPWPTTEFDISGYHYNGTYKTAPTYSPGVRYNTTFTATSNYVVTPIPNIIKPSPITISLWFKQTARGNMELLGCWEGGGGGIFVNTSTNTNKLVGELYIGSGYQQVFCDTLHDLNIWHHVALTFDGQYERIYLNGVLRGTKDLGAGKTINYHNTAPWQVNGNPSGSAAGSPTFQGSLSDFRIYTTALSADDIKALYNQRNDN